MAQQLPDVSGVFLLHMGLIVFVIGPGAGLVDALGLQPAADMMIEELGSVVAVDPFQFKGLGGFYSKI